jgi:Stress-induced bacterial acidophilic repeat motif
MPTNNPNPGNFANRPKEEVKAIASKGGKSGTDHKGFASEKYDDDKHVS